MIYCANVEAELKTSKVVLILCDKVALVGRRERSVRNTLLKNACLSCAALVQIDEEKS